MLPQGYLEQIAQMKLTLEQAVTFASLIEMEAFHDDEKPKVAEVISLVTLPIEVIHFGAAFFQLNSHSQQHDG